MLISFQVIYFLLHFSFSKLPTTIVKVDTKINQIECLYNDCQLSGVVNFDAFRISLEGFEKFHPQKSIITIVDFSLPSNVERFFCD